MNDKIKDLKAEVYDILAHIEQLQLQIQDFQKMMQEKNKQIQEIYGKAEAVSSSSLQAQAEPEATRNTLQEAQQCAQVK